MAFKTRPLPGILALLIVVAKSASTTSAATPTTLIPWEAPPDAPPPPWSGLQPGDLDALLRVQARNNTVSVVVFNDGFYAVTLNCLASMYRYAALDNIIVAAAGARSLAKCRALRLPCFDAATLVAAYSSSNGNSSNSSATAADARRNSPEWFQLVWLKTLVAHAVVSRGYNLLFADADTVFLKDATKAYTEFLDRYGADGTFMYEEANQTREDGTPYLNRYLNSGNFFLRSNARTKRMMSMWTVGYRFQSRNNGNQLWLNKLERLGYKNCHAAEQCARYAASGWAAIKPHPNQFDGTGQMCTPHTLPEGLCTDRRLYVHAVCRAGQHLKREAFERLGLWFVHVNPDNATDIKLTFPSNEQLPCGGTTWAGDNYPAF